MTIRGYWIQGLTTAAADVRRPFSDLLLPAPVSAGVKWDTASTSLKVTALGSPAMFVQVDKGWGKSGDYLGNNDTSGYQVAITAADGSNPRTDLIVMRWRDVEAGDGSDSCTIEVVTGVAGPSHTTPATPSRSTLLATVLVAAAATTIVSGAITDARVLYVPIGSVGRVASQAERDALSLYEGCLVDRADLDALDRCDGAAWSTVTVGGARTSYTPTLTASSSNPTLGSGSSRTGKYSKIGRQVDVDINIAFGSSGTAAGSGNYIISLPVTAAASPVGKAGFGSIKCAGVTTYVHALFNGVSGVFLRYNSQAVAGTDTTVTHSLPGAWTSNDSITLKLSYEAAS